MRAFIIEDEPAARNNLSRLLTANFPDIEIVGEVGSVRAAVDWFSAHTCDVVFMDVELQDGNCFEIFRQIRIDAFVVMTTAYDNYAVKAFDVNSIDYLLKPIDLPLLSRAVQRCRDAGEHSNIGKIWEALSGALPGAVAGAPGGFAGGPSASLPGGFAQNGAVAGAPGGFAGGIPGTLPGAVPPKNYRERYIIRINDRIVPVNVNQIAWIESENKSSYIVLENSERYVFNPSLDEAEAQLCPDTFFRISRSHIVSKNSIKSIIKLVGGRLRLVTEPAGQLEVSRARVDDFLKWIEK